MQRKAAKTSKLAFSSRNIRETFVNYFVQENGHKFVRSSPVVPFCDNSIAFVNAGMNQFKNIFLGKETPLHPRAANSQKCIRVGGKHNDLNIVGTDGYHHTFFEMLGNWSFGDYFKKEACSMAFNLLTGPYQINQNRLYVTYFGGDAALNLDADLECAEIWREIGIPKERILPFGKKDNFWEMGSTGPCGPCTEIHFDHVGDGLRSACVNQGLPDLTELWNLVFIQYNRKDDGTVENLPEKHIDTGMGFERLAAILQEKSSNYDTDLFLPIFDVIQKVTKVDGYQGTFTRDLDRDYRILADHSRMITACIADGMFPDHNHKLRRILRKSIQISEKTFKASHLMKEVTAAVSDILGEVYPEMTDLRTIQAVIDHEIEVYSALRTDVRKSLKNTGLSLQNLIDFDLLDYPGFLPAYKDLLPNLEKFEKSADGQKILPSHQALRLFSTFGLDEEAIERVCSLTNLKFNPKSFKIELNESKLKSKAGFSQANDAFITKLNLKSQDFTQDSFKYDYTFNEETKTYKIQPLNVKILSSFKEKNDLFCLITDKTNFYVESGGQESDSAVIKTKNFDLKVTHSATEKGLTLHFGRIIRGTFTPNVSSSSSATIEIDENHRTRNIFHHTATHILNAVVRHLKNAPTCQKSSQVTASGLKLELAIYGPRLTKDDFACIESNCRRIISQNSPVSIEFIDLRGLLERKNVTMVPGEVYPDKNLRLVEIPGSAELCCGTHASNTGELQDFCLTNVKLLGRASYQFTAIAGPEAQESHSKSQKLEKKVQEFEKSIEGSLNEENLKELELRIREFNSILVEGIFEKVEISFITKLNLKEKMEKIDEKVRNFSRKVVKNQMDEELKNLRENQRVLVMKSKSIIEEIPLNKINFGTDVKEPLLVVAFGNHVVIGRCFVPSSWKSKIDEKMWMTEVAKVFKTNVIQQGENVCSFKPKRVSEAFFDGKIGEILKISEEFWKKVC